MVASMPLLLKTASVITRVIKNYDKAERMAVMVMVMVMIVGPLAAMVIVMVVAAMMQLMVVARVAVMTMMTLMARKRRGRTRGRFRV